MDAGVKAQMKKMERAYMNDTIATRLSLTEHTAPQPGSMVVLGKMFVLSKGIKKDTPMRIGQSITLLRAILFQAETNKQSVFISSLRRALGVWVFITDGCVFLRTHLRGKRPASLPSPPAAHLHACGTVSRAHCSPLAAAQA